jgi:hypothetical protein
LLSSKIRNIDERAIIGFCRKSSQAKYYLLEDSWNGDCKLI